MHHRFAAAALAAAAATGVAAVAPAAHAAPAAGPLAHPSWLQAPLPVGDVTRTDISFEVHVNLEKAMGEPDQVCNVDATLYVPKTATPATPAPAILTTNGFGGTKADTGATSSDASYALQYARQGYVTLSYAGLGFGGSTCQIELDGPAFDGEAGAALVDFLGGESPSQSRYLLGAYPTFTKSQTGPGTWSGTPVAAPPVLLDRAGDPRIGMIGGSYGGQIQFAVADEARNADGTAKLDALIPQITWNDLTYSLAPNNEDPAGVPAGGVAPVTQDVTRPGVEKVQWDSLFFGLGASQPLQGKGGAVSQDPTSTTVPAPCPNYDAQICASYLQLASESAPDATAVHALQSASVGSYISAITMPVFLSQGQDDTLFNLREAATTFKALEAQGTPAKMLWQQWGHSGGSVVGEADGTANEPELFDDLRYSAWFAYYLKGDRAARAGIGPAFEYVAPWVADNGTNVTGAGTPTEVAGTPDTAQVLGAPDYPVGSAQPLYLSASPAPGGNGSLVTDPSAAAAGSQAFAASAVSATSYSETSALDQSQPVRDTPGTFAAFDSAPLAADADQVGSPTLTVTLSSPTFAATQGDTSGQLVLFAKLYDVAPSGTATLANRIVSPVRVTDITQPVTISLPAIVHRYPAGDHLELVLAQGDAAYNGNRGAGVVSVRTGPGTTDVLRVPLTDGAGTAFAAGGPTPALPEAGLPAALLAGGAAVGGAVLLRRRRRHAA